MATPIPPLDLSRFQWRRSPDDPALHIREAAGTEAIHDAWNRIYNGQGIMFFGVEISLRTSVPADAFITHAREAWSAIRFEIPTVASQVSLNEAGFVFITYRPASSRDDVDAWAQRTVRVPTSSTPQSFDDLRGALGRDPVPEANGDQTFLHVLPRAKDGEFGILIHTSHTPFDGGGVRILMNRFLARLADCLTGHSTYTQLSWGDEAKNLLPSITAAIRPEEPLSGADYDKTLYGILGEMQDALPRQHGFKLRALGPGATRRLGHRFSKAQTDRIIQHARAHGLTVNNIVNAAVILVTALDNPPTPTTPADAAFVFYGILDARNHLAPPYSARHGYPAPCLGTAIIQVPLSVLPPDWTHSGDAALRALIKVAGAIKDEYAKAKGYHYLLAVQPQILDMIHAGIRAGQPPGPQWIGPWYSGDGPAEKYLDVVHINTAGTPVFDVEDVWLSVNTTEPGPLFRANSWKDELQLSVDTNEAAMPVEVVQGFLDKWVELILAFADSE